MDLLKQSTAATLLIGPFVDATDGVTAEDALTISQADVRLSKNGGNMAQKNEATACTHDELGYYTCPLDTTDTGTLGVLKVMVSEAGALPVWQEYMVVPAAVYDSIVAGSDKLPVDAQEWQSVAITSGSVPAAVAGATGGLALVGSKVDLVDAPNATGVGVIQAGLSTYAGGDTAGTTTLLSRLTALRAGYLDNLSAGAVALEATLTAIKGAGWSTETLAAMKVVLDAAAADVAGLDGAAMVAAAPSAVDIATQTDTTLSATHGAGTWGGAAGSGSRTVVVTVQTSGGTVYANVPVTMNNQAETGTSYTLLTDSLGQCTFYLTDGDWRAIAAGTNLQSGGATNYTVNGPETVTVTVTAVTVPATTSAANYLLYGYERKLEADAAFGASGVTVKVLSVDSTGQYDAAANACRRIMGTSYTTDANGLWSFEVAKTLADRRLKLQFVWTDAASIVQTEEWQATILASAANGSDQIAWADLSPTKTR